MLSMNDPVLTAAEGEALRGDVNAALRALRRLCLDDFAEVMLRLPIAEYPALSRQLPRMASEEVQKSWTGESGYPLLNQSIAFIRLLELNYLRFCKEELSGARILDFGCGYGRLIRLAYYFSNPAEVYGCDPWEKSIELCRNDGMLGNLRVSDYLPRLLPFEGQKFDLIYAYSVFTHLSHRAAQTALSVLRDYLESHGLLAITIRPVEFWDFGENTGNPLTAQALKADHREKGFAFQAHEWTEIDGDITYGDTSMSIDYLRKLARGWEVQTVERSLCSPHQIVVFMAPTPS